jgi:hypothetical protein
MGNDSMLMMGRVRRRASNLCNIRKRGHVTCGVGGGKHMTQWNGSILLSPFHWGATVLFRPNHIWLWSTAPPTSSEGNQNKRDTLARGRGIGRSPCCRAGVLCSLVPGSWLAFRHAGAGITKSGWHTGIINEGVCLAWLWQRGILIS